MEEDKEPGIPYGPVADRGPTCGNIEIRIAVLKKGGKWIELFKEEELHQCRNGGYQRCSSKGRGHHSIKIINKCPFYKKSNVCPSDHEPPVRK